MTDKLVKTDSRFSIQPKKFGIAARLQNATTELVADNSVRAINRLGIIFDDSASMEGDAIKQAHEAIDVFVKNCNRADTALALYPLNTSVKKLTMNFADIALYGMSIPATGGTPLYSKLSQLLAAEPITRAIAFSDGQPGDSSQKETCIAAFKNKNIPIDTVFIGTAGIAYGDYEMKELAERTGGIFLHFTDSSVLAKSFKYLTPAYRAMLMNPEIKAKIEKGEL